MSLCLISCSVAGGVACAPGCVTPPSRLMPGTLRVSTAHSETRLIQTSTARADGDDALRHWHVLDCTSRDFSSSSGKAARNPAKVDSNVKERVAKAQYK